MRMAESGIRLIFGGGRIGLMGVLADAVLDGGGTVIGIIPKHLASVEIAHGGLTELHVVDSMHTRKQKMFDLADAFVVLPGGLGTLDETMEILTWRQLSLHDKPVVVLNHNGYWLPLETLIRHTIDAGFVPPEAAAFYSVVATVDELFAAIATAPTPTLSAVTEPL